MTPCIVEGVLRFLVEHEGGTFENAERYGGRRRGQLYLALLQLCLLSQQHHREASDCSRCPQSPRLPRPTRPSLPGLKAAHKSFEKPERQVLPWQLDLRAIS